ncbi:MAG: DUF3795 domain-containing protein [Chloroflexota bacterium]
MKIEYPEIGVCGLSCRFCPRYHTEGKSRCGGCKSEFRMGAGCPFITCAIKRKGIEFCWDCQESDACGKWRKHRDFGKEHDSFKCYQRLEDDISFIRKSGVKEFDSLQRAREALIREMLRGFNEGRSKSYYCIAATVLETGELQRVLSEARDRSEGIDVREKSRLLHSLLDAVAAKRGYYLGLRK